MRPCDVCDMMFKEADATHVAELTPGIIADDWVMCPTCFVEGVVAGDIKVNPEAGEAEREAREDREGEEWKG